MKAFEDAKFTEWRARTEQILPTLQKRNVLKELPLAESMFILSKRDWFVVIPTISLDQNPYTPRYIIDYDPQLNEMTTEARYLEQFDYVLPENIRHLALNVSANKPSYSCFLPTFQFPKVVLSRHNWCFSSEIYWIVKFFPLRTSPGHLDPNFLTICQSKSILFIGRTIKTNLNSIENRS